MVYSFYMQIPPDTKNTAVPTILEIVRKGLHSTEVDHYEAGNISIIGETHLVAGSNDKIVPVVQEKIAGSHTVFLEFDPDSILAATYKAASVSESASSIAKKLANEGEKPIVILDAKVSSPMSRFEQVGFTREESVKAYGCQLGIQYFIERPNESATFVIGDFLTKLGVPENTTIEVCNRVHNGIMGFLRNEEGYGMFDFLRDYSLGDSVIRDREYAGVIKRTLGDDPNQGATVVIGKSHAKPIADILNNEYQPPENIDDVIQNVREYINR